MYLFAVANLAIGEMVQVEFRNPSSQKLVRVFGTVRSRAVYLYGLEFVPSGFSHPGSPQPKPWSSPANLSDESSSAQGSSDPWPPRCQVGATHPYLHYDGGSRNRPVFKAFAATKFAHF